MIDVNTSDVVTQATVDLLAFWDEARRRFHRVPETKSKGGTSSPRATFALIDSLRHLEGPGRSIEASTREAVVEVLRARASGLAEQFEEQRLSNINERNAFTDSHVAIEAQVLSWLSDDRPDTLPTCALLRVSEGIREALEGHAEDLAGSTLEDLESYQGARLATQPHDFLTYYACRLLYVRNKATPDAVLPRVQSSVVEQIAYQSAGSAARFDLGALVFGLALLQQGGDRYEPLVARGLEIVIGNQAPDGSWPELRAIYHDDKTLFISSYEVALTLSNLLLNRLQRRPLEDCVYVVDALCRTLSLARVERRQGATGHTGWANDRNPSPETVESWTTAVVASFAARLAQVATQANLISCQTRYDLMPTSSGEKGQWPDLDRLRRVETRRKLIINATSAGAWTGVPLSISDPTDPGDVAHRLVEDYIKPVLFDWAERPAKNGVSALLPGDPGTRKTTLVRELAHAIDWPLIILTPPVFLREGLERFEAEAAAIFRDLLRLERVVVLFDECEEFFRSRASDNVAPGSRTSGAFITAGMLPRLQALHDQRSVLFVVATNAKIKELDRAAIRPGRFDRTFNMEHPRSVAQRRYIESVLIPDGPAASTDAVAQLTRLVEESETINDGAVPFSALDEFIEAYRNQGTVPASLFDEIVQRSFGWQMG